MKSNTKYTAAQITILTSDFKKKDMLFNAGESASPVIGTRNGEAIAAANKSKEESSKIATAEINEPNTDSKKNSKDRFMAYLMRRFCAGDSALKSSGMVSLVGRLIISPNLKCYLKNLHILNLA